MQVSFQYKKQQNSSFVEVHKVRSCHYTFMSNIHQTFLKLKYRRNKNNVYAHMYIQVNEKKVSLKY